MIVVSDNFTNQNPIAIGSLILVLKSFSSMVVACPRWVFDIIIQIGCALLYSLMIL